MAVQKYDDGVAFLKEGVEIAFYSYLVDRIPSIRNQMKNGAIVIVVQ